MSDRQVPAIVAQRIQVAKMDWDQCNEAWHRVDSKQVKDYPSPYKLLLEGRMAELELAERISLIDHGSRDQSHG